MASIAPKLCFLCGGMIYSHQSFLAFDSRSGKLPQHRHASKGDCISEQDKCVTCGQVIDFTYAKNHRVIYHGDVATGITTVSHEKCPEMPRTPEPEPKSFTAPKGAP